jgi:hypothetical protein
VKSGGTLSQEQVAAVRRFGEAAQRLCDVLDGADALVRGDLLGQLVIHLPDLASAARALPPAPEGDSATQAPAHDDAWRALAERLHKALGPDDLYWRPDEQDGPVVAGSLGDDLADIDRELRRGLRAADRGDLAEAATAWRDGFDRRWGRHLDGALEPLVRLAEETGTTG